MGIFDALTTAVAGLQAQSFALQNISGNIANSQTTGYKEIDTSFADLVSQAALQQQTTDGVIASSAATNTVQGTINSTSVSTDMAINGDGFFVVAQPTGFTDNQPNFNGVSDYTRAGDFQLNANGNLVNGAGYYLMGIPVSATTGNPTGSVPQVLQFQNSFVPAQETTQIQYQVNLPSKPAATLDESNFQANPIAGAQIIGSGATLLPDAVATSSSSITTLTATTALTSGDTYTVNDGSNTTTFTAGGTSTVADLINAINSGPANNVTAALSNGQIVLTGTSPTASITVGGTGRASIGFAATTAQPVDLLTQGAVTSGQTLTVTVAGGTPQTITFGTGAGDVATLAQLQTAIQGLTGVIGSVDANGDISLTGTDATSTLGIGGTANAANFGILTTSATPATGGVIGNDVSTFDSESVDGGSITAYDSDGNSVNVDLRWAKISSASGSTGTDAWQLFYQTNSGATGTQAAWQNAGTTFTFNSSGEMSPAVSGVTLQNLTVNGDSLGNVQVSFGNGGLTQFATSGTTAQVSQLQQNGFAAGQLQSVSVDSQNRVVGSFSNGQTIPLAEITLATFNGEDSLQALNGGAYAATTESGPPIYSATGKIVGSSLESSNVDISTQFSNLIVAQQAYSANARVMSTADQMIQSLLQVIQ